MTTRVPRRLVTQQVATTDPAMSEPTQSSALSFWERIRALTAEASALTVAKWLFLLVALVDLPLILSGFWFGFSVLTQIGTILAVSMCICGLALNFFTKPWIWLVAFLLLSPLSSGLYIFVVITNIVGHSVIDWPTYCIYLLPTPIAGALYGLFGPTRRSDEILTASFTKGLTLTIWFLGVGLFVVGFGVPIVTYIGLAWTLASGILAVAQLIRLKQSEWLLNLIISLVVLAGTPLFFLGFIYGAFGPTTEE